MWKICQKECQIQCQNIYIYMYVYIYIYTYTYAINTSRWYVRNYVRIVCKGEDHLKNVFFGWSQRVIPLARRKNMPHVHGNGRPTYGKTCWTTFNIHIHHPLCSMYGILPTFARFLGQMCVNIPYMEHNGSFMWKVISQAHYIQAPLKG